jgi:hypothetical protein
MLARLARARGGTLDPAELADAAGGDDLAAELLALVDRARAEDRDPEALLRAAMTRLASS